MALPSSDQHRRTLVLAICSDQHAKSNSHRHPCSTIRLGLGAREVDALLMLLRSPSPRPKSMQALFPVQAFWNPVARGPGQKFDAWRLAEMTRSLHSPSRSAARSMDLYYVGFSYGSWSGIVFAAAWHGAGACGAEDIWHMAL